MVNDIGMLTDKPKVSVIVPAYNVEKYIETAIVDLRKQTYPNLEIIIVDDGSTDHTLEICKEQEKLDIRIIVITKTNGGVSSARNAGMSVASGEWIGFMDPDDRIDPEMYELMLNDTEGRGIDCIACRAKQEYRDNFSLTNRHNINFGVTIYKGQKECCLAITHKPASIGVFVWNKLFRKKLINGLQFDQNLTVLEDAVFVYRALDKAKTIKVIDVPCYHYRYLFDGLTRSSKTAEYLRSIGVLDQLIDYFEAKKIGGVDVELKKLCLFLSARCLETIPLVRNENERDLCDCARNNIYKYYSVVNDLTFLKKIYVVVAMRSFVFYKMGVVVKRNCKRMKLILQGS